MKKGHCFLMEYHLEIAPEYPEDYDALVALWEERKFQHENDVGLDLPYLHQKVVFPKAVAQKLSLGYRMRLYTQDGLFHARTYLGYYVLPRSSITKCPMRMANSIGLIDPTYTGPVLTCVDSLAKHEFEIGQGASFFQLNSPLFMMGNYKLHIHVVHELESTERGDGGFGSTNAAMMGYKLTGKEEVQKESAQKESDTTTLFLQCGEVTIGNLN